MRKFRILKKLRVMKNSLSTLLLTYLYRKRVKSMGNNCKVNAICHFGSNTFIGEDCHFNGISIVGAGKLTIGDHFHSGNQIMIFTSSHNYQSKDYLPYGYDQLIKDVVIGKCVWLGSRSLLLPGSKLGDGVIVQAGAVVHGSIPSCAIVGGNPAQIIKFRDKAIFKKLLKNKSFI